jgi:hypothetical protein
LSLAIFTYTYTNLFLLLQILDDYEKKKDQEQAVMDWIEEVTDYELDDFFVNLKTGEVLCDLANAIRPETVLKIHRGDNIRPAQARVCLFFWPLRNYSNN